jgi:hypothetical protein
MFELDGALRNEQRLVTPRHEEKRVLGDAGDDFGALE